MPHSWWEMRLAHQLLAAYLLLALTTGSDVLQVEGEWVDEGPRNHPLAHIDKDPQPPFPFNRNAPFAIEFGRGSGMYGLNTFKMTEDGLVTLHRLRIRARRSTYETFWERATLFLPAESVAKVIDAVEKNQLLHMPRGYHANVADGTQWVLLIRQGNNAKSVYFNNHFPSEILRFAQELDLVLGAAGLGELTWQAVSDNRPQKELWASVNRR